MRKSEPWYIHTVLYVIIVVLVYLLIRVAIIDPTETLEQEKSYKNESRLRMSNLREAEILWEKKHGNYTDNLDSLIHFIKTDSSVLLAINGIDTVTGKSTNPFIELSNGGFSADSLYKTPKSQKPYILKYDESTEIDTVIDVRGRLVKIDTISIIGTRYLLECPDGYGKIGDEFSDALRNTASWE